MLLIITLLIIILWLKPVKTSFFVCVQPMSFCILEYSKGFFFVQVVTSFFLGSVCPHISLKKEEFGNNPRIAKSLHIHSFYISNILCIKVNIIIRRIMQLLHCTHNENIFFLFVHAWLCHQR